MPLSSATDIVTLAQAKERLGVTGSAADDEITGILTAGVEFVENEVRCSMVERPREDVMEYVPSGQPIVLQRGLLLLPAVAEQRDPGTGDITQAGQAARSIVLSYSPVSASVNAPPTETLVLTAETTRVDFGEDSLGPVGADNPYRFGRARVFPPSGSWPQRRGPLLVCYRTGAPTLESIPQSWREAVLEYVRDVYDRDDAQHEFVRNMLAPYARFY